MVAQLLASEGFASVEDVAFVDLGECIREQLVDVGAMLARGRKDNALPKCSAVSIAAASTLV